MAKPWEKEVRIFEFCIQKANEIETELRSSGGDHYEDIEILDGLREGWQVLIECAKEEGLNEAIERKRRG